jgi:hypothetical protein
MAERVAARYFSRYSAASFAGAHANQPSTGGSPCVG